MLPLLETLMALPFAGALAVALSRTGSRRKIGWLAAAAPLLGLALLAWMTPAVLSGEVPQSSHAWIAQAGLLFTLRLDGLAWMFAGLVLGIGVLIVMYARYYLSGNDSPRRFFAYLLLFMGAMLGMVIAGNLLLLVVFWELTSISSFLLIGFWHQRNDAREGARMALSITGAGGLALLAGVLLIGKIVGSFELDVVLASGDLIRASALYPAVLGLVLLGIFTKSAQFPFHFWLPHAMAAPTPVSAYLHSATMVKAGVFLLARLHPVLSGTDLFFYVVCSVGAVTLLLGSWKAIFQHDIKGLLAYSTISHLGLITLLFGMSTPLAVVAGLFHIINHAVFKASLFMAAGIIDHETGSRDMRRLGGLRKYMPITSALAIVATLAMAGIPLLSGFLCKEMFFAEALELSGHGGMGTAISIAAFVFGAFGVAYSLRFVHDTFFGSWPRPPEAAPHEPAIWMRIPVTVLVLLCLAVGMAPAWTVAPILAAAAHAVLGPAMPEYNLAVWHGFNLPVLMSLGGIVSGIVLYFGLRRLLDIHAIIVGSLGRDLFRGQIKALLTLAWRFTRGIGNNSLQRYLLLMVLATLVLAAAPFFTPGASVAAANATTQPMPLTGWMVWIMLMVGTLGTVVLHRQRLLAVIMIGAVGLAVSLSFVLLSAPDLALTQLLVEMVTVALMLLALNYLPDQSPPERPALRRWRDAAIALAAGAGVAALVYAMLVRPADTVAGELLARSLSEGYGSNVVNVILVDFRGLDTLGEIAVFGIAGLVVHALLRRARLRPEHVMPGTVDRLPMPAVLGNVLFPLALAVSAYLFLRGHNQPGGGFIAGLVLAMPLLLQYVIQGSHYVESRLGFDYARCIGIGLLLSALTGIVSMWLGYPFLTSGHAEPVLPLIGKIPLASALGFDTGVYLAVFGGAMLILSMMGTIRPPRMRATEKPA